MSDSPVNQNGFVSIHFSENNLEALGDFFPPNGNGQPLRLEIVEELLSEGDIVHGILWDKIGEFILACNSNRVVIKDCVIARGDKPKAFVPSYIRLKDRLFNQAYFPNESGGRVDFKGVRPYVVVKKDEPLGKVIPAVKGEPGRSVKGEEIPYPKKEKIVLTPGINIKNEDGIIVAGCAGRFQRNDNEFWVNETLEISGSVDYHTGHINFPGDVILSGAIRDGFKVFAGGSILAKETIDAFEIYSKKNIESQSGIIGRTDGLVKVGGDLKAKFIEHCHAQVKGDLYIKDSIVNSEIKTLGFVRLGDKGTIVGSDVYAVKGVRAVRIGNAAGIRTSIVCGTAFLYGSKLNELKELQLKMIGEIDSLESRLNVNPSPDGEQRIEKMRESLKGVTKAIEGVFARLNEPVTAEVIVTGELFPGVVIEMNNASIKIDTVQKKVKIVYDQKTLNLRIEPLNSR